MKLCVRTILTFLTLFAGLSLFSQNPDRCGTFERHQEKMLTDPNYAEQYEEKMDRIQSWLRDNRNEAKADCDEILYLPVAVHYQNVGIDMACAIDMAVDQINILNADYGATNTDLQNFLDAQPGTWANIQNKASCVQFCLATLNHPAGSGIAEGDYAITLNEYDEIDNIPEWSGYLNLFVRPGAGGVLGYSPLGGNGNGDGVVCGIEYFGSVSCGGNTLSPQYNLGRTCTHEIGHFLSLSHPFDSGNCTADGDNIADTPLTDQATYGCNPIGEQIIQCTEPKLWPSYMDYSDDACMYMFTEGQVDQMEAYVNTSLTNLLDGATIKCEDAACVQFDVAFSSQDETCNGNDASIVFNADGGTEPYNYSITNGLTSSANESFQNLSADKYLLYVIDDQGCEFQDSVIITQETPPISLVSSSSAFCGDNSGSLEVSVSYPDHFEFSIDGIVWRDTSYFGNLTAGTYTVVARNDGGCSNSLDVDILDETDLNIIERQVKPVNCPLSDNGLIYLELSNGQEPVVWRFEDENPTDDAYFDKLSPGQYTVTVQDGRGCREIKTYTIGVSYTNVSDDCPCQVFIPNAITPDEDGKNDVFKIVASCPISDYKMIIANRWGDVIFESDDPEEVWNGGIDDYYNPTDVYFYKISFRWGEDLNESLEVQTRNGFITILR